MLNAPSEFWDFSLRIYPQPEVSDECLRLQERQGINVNLLLFCAFCGANFGAKLSAEDLAEASARVLVWHASVTRSLRLARTSIRQLKLKKDVTSPIGDQIENLRQSVKQLELAAERIEHDILENWWQAKSSAVLRSNPAYSIRSNIALLLGPTVEAPALANAALADRNGQYPTAR